MKIILDNAGNVILQDHDREEGVIDFALFIPDPRDSGAIVWDYLNGGMMDCYEYHDDAAEIYPSEQDIASGRYRVFNVETFADLRHIDSESSWYNERELINALGRCSLTEKIDNCLFGNDE